MNKYFKEIDSLGGVVSAIEKGYFQYEISRSASSHQKKIDNKELIHVGVNDFIKSDEKIDIPILEIGRDVESYQKKKIASLRKSRNNDSVEKTLSKGITKTASRLKDFRKFNFLSICINIGILFSGCKTCLG